MVGVSKENLCQADGTWAENRVIDLFPWDIGTESGLRYDSPSSPSRPRQPIQRITSSNPNNPQSPFFDPTSTILTLSDKYKKQGEGAVTRVPRGCISPRRDMVPGGTEDTCSLLQQRPSFIADVGDILYCVYCRRPDEADGETSPDQAAAIPEGVSAGSTGTNGFVPLSMDLNLYF